MANSTQIRSGFLLLWKRLPVIVRAIILGVIVTAAGTLPWAYLVHLNIEYFPSVPWSLIPTAIYLWFYWRYLRGDGWPRSTSAVRKNLLRANQLTGEVWGASILAGIFGLASLVLFSGVFNRLVRLPQQDASGVEHVPMLSLFFIVVMSSVVAGVAEESGVRGYMQKPIEQRHGPLVAILITGIIFALLHFSHPETTLALIPFYFFVATIYGMLAYITNSILPGMILHAIGDVSGGMSLYMSGQSEWQQTPVPKPLIWESGIDRSFLFSLFAFIIVGSITVWAYKNLAREVKKEETRSF